MFPKRLLTQAEFASACVFRARAHATTELYARHYFVEGVPQPAIAARYGVSKQAVWKALQRFELAIQRMEAGRANTNDDASAG